MRIGIDLLWVRPGKNGGTESYIRNLLDGFSRYADKQYRFILFTTHLAKRHLIYLSQLDCLNGLNTTKLFLNF